MELAVCVPPSVAEIGRGWWRMKRMYTNYFLKLCAVIRFIRADPRCISHTLIEAELERVASISNL